MDDDLMPNEGQAFHIPAERVIEDNQERARVMASAPILSDILDWFDERIAQCDSIAYINVGGTVNVEVQVLAQQRTRATLIDMRAQLTAMHDRYMPNLAK